MFFAQKKKKMEGIRSNWRVVRPVLEQAIRNACFVSIDTELTGLLLRLKDRNQPGDSMAERYSKLKSTSNFAVPQYGLATFQWQPEHRNYLCCAFNIFLFQRGQETRFSVQSSSLEFLAGHNFDFNKWIREGVSYVDKESYEKAKGQLLMHTEGQTNLIKLEGDNLAFSESIIKQVEDWLQNVPTKTFDLPKCNSFHRRVIFEQVHAKYGDAIGVDSILANPESHDKIIRLTRLTTEEKQLRALQKANEANQNFEESVGFTAVINLITELEKPIVGHNMLLDLIHTLSKFVGPMPETLEEFKQQAHKTFPHIFDTKYITNLPQFKSSKTFETTSLGDLYSLLNKPEHRQKPLIVGNNETYERYVNGQAFHEAGFDAYATGVVFLRLVHRIAADAGLDIAGTDLISSDLLLPYANRLYIMQSAFSLNLTGEDVSMIDVNRSIHVSNFDTSMRTPHISALFVELGVESLLWLSDSSVLVVLERVEPVEVIASKVKARHPEIEIITAREFYERKHQLALASSPASVKRTKTE